MSYNLFLLLAEVIYLSMQSYVPSQSFHFSTHCQVFFPGHCNIPRLEQLKSIPSLASLSQFFREFSKSSQDLCVWPKSVTSLLQRTSEDMHTSLLWHFQMIFFSLYSTLNCNSSFLLHFLNVSSSRHVPLQGTDQLWSFPLHSQSCTFAFSMHLPLKNKYLASEQELLQGFHFGIHSSLHSWSKHSSGLLHNRSQQRTISEKKFIFRKKANTEKYSIEFFLPQFGIDPEKNVNVLYVVWGIKLAFTIWHLSHKKWVNLKKIGWNFVCLKTWGLGKYKD